MRKKISERLSVLTGGKAHRIKKRLSRYILFVLIVLLIIIGTDFYSLLIIGFLVVGVIMLNIYLSRINAGLLSPKSNLAYNTNLKENNKPRKKIYRDGLGHWCVIKNEGKRFNILHLSDIHIGNGFVSFKKDRVALEAIRQLIHHAQPDLIVVSGDMVYPVPFLSGSGNNLQASRLFAGFMESFEIPWTITFGNHDEEICSWYPLETICEVYEKSRNCLFQRGPEDVTGLSNHFINIINSAGTLNTSLVMLDSHAYIHPFWVLHYDYIREDQVNWYAEKLYALSADYKLNSLPPSLAFFHIPLNEFDDAWELYQRDNQSAEVNYHYGHKVEKVSAPLRRSSLFRKMVDLGSTKGVFVGHDHYNDFSITYRGIRLTYGKSIDYLAYAGIARSSWQRGGTLIEIDENANFEVTPLSLSNIISNK